MSTPLLKAEAYFAARRKHDEAKAIADAAYREVQRTERELVDEMLDHQMQNFTLRTEAGDLQVSMREEFSMAVNKDNEFLVSEWLQQTEGDVRQFVKEILHKPTIVAHVKKLIESGKLDRAAVPEFFQLNTYPSLQVRGWKK